MDRPALYLPTRIRDPRFGYKQSTEDRKVRTDTARAVETEHWYGEQDVHIQPDGLRGVMRQAPDGQYGEIELNLPGAGRLWVPREAVEAWKAKYG